MGIIYTNSYIEPIQTNVSKSYYCMGIKNNMPSLVHKKNNYRIKKLQQNKIFFIIYYFCTKFYFILVHILLFYQCQMFILFIYSFQNIKKCANK